MAAIDWKQIVARWRESGRTPATISRYLYWARRYVGACWRRGDLADCLTERRVKRFYAAQVRAGDTTPPAAVRALACALTAMGSKLPAWRSPPPRRPLPPLVREFVAYRLSHRGVAPASARFDAEVASAFLRSLGERGRTVAHVRLADVDAFVQERARRWAPISVAAASLDVEGLPGVPVRHEPVQGRSGGVRHGPAHPPNESSAACTAVGGCETDSPRHRRPAGGSGRGTSRSS